MSGFRVKVLRFKELKGCSDVAFGGLGFQE